MRLKSLKLINFRNYETLNIEFDKGYNIIYGNNGQGKTNIIEAVFLCAAGRSHRTAKDSELVLYDKEGFNVGLEVQSLENDCSIEIKYLKNEKKKIKVNEIPLKKIGDLMGRLNAVIFSPEDLFIVKQGPAERRRFIDMTLSQMKPSYFFDIQQYYRILLQRNYLLRDINSGKTNASTLEIWNQHLVKTGSVIIKKRAEFLTNLAQKAEARHLKLTAGSEKLGIVYKPSFSTDKFEGTDDIETRFFSSLQSEMRREIQRCTTILGPHRDDFDIMLDGKSTKSYGSQGQQRTSMLSLKLAEIDLMQEDKGEFPVLLLDDVLSELDLSRQRYLFDTIAEMQTIITCTDKSFFSETSGRAKYFFISNGSATTFA